MLCTPSTAVGSGRAAERLVADPASPFAGLTLAVAFLPCIFLKGSGKSRSVIAVAPSAPCRTSVPSVSETLSCARTGEERLGCLVPLEAALQVPASDRHPADTGGEQGHGEGVSGGTGGSRDTAGSGGKRWHGWEPGGEGGAVHGAGGPGPSRWGSLRSRVLPGGQVTPNPFCPCAQKLVHSFWV